jgi:hypothetical protein
MAEVIRGRHGDSINDDSYARSISIGADVSPEPPPRPKPTFLNKRDMLRRFDWTETDFQFAIGLEEPLKFPRVALTNRWPARPVWREDLVERWAMKVRSHAAALQQLVR